MHIISLVTSQPVIGLRRISAQSMRLKRIALDINGINHKLDTGHIGSQKWKDLDIDESYVDSETSLAKLSEIAVVVEAAWVNIQGLDPGYVFGGGFGRQYEKPNPLATLWHWAAKCNKPWPISQFLKDPIACESLMALDSNGKTALDVAIGCGNTAIAEMLQAYITKNNLVVAQPVAHSSLAVASSTLLSSATAPLPALSGKAPADTFVHQSSMANAKKEEASLSSPDSKFTTPPRQVSTSESSASASSSHLKPSIDETGGVRVQFTIPYSALTFGKSLGEGGFGIVYHGKYANADVAIKCIQSHKLTEDALEELKSESIFMVQLRHPHIVQCYGACLEAGHYSIVMELMPQGSLYDLLQSKQDIPWSLRALLATDIASGLSYLHGQQIVHRDLKSMNVLLGEGLRAKISDFGLSRVKTESQATSANTKKAIGTTRWMAPELFEDEPSNTSASDVYSFAMVLWELTSRKLPYEKLKTDAQVTRAIDKGQKEIIPDDCPLELSQVITACWETKPKHRLTSSQAAEQLSVWCSLFSVSSKSGISSRSFLDSGMQAPQSSGYAPMPKK